MAGKTRSRNYPVFGLGEAIKRVGELYEADGKAAVATDVAVRAWGYKTLNGASLRTLGAVRQYGLLDNAGTKLVRLSPIALTIVLEPVDSAERTEAIATAAETPAMFREIRDQYPDGLPSDLAIVSWLVRNRTFTGSAAKDLVAAYRSTLDLVAEEGRREKAKAIPSHQKLADPQPAIDDKRPPAEQPKVARTGLGSEVMEFSWPLSGEAVATLVVTKGLEQDDIETLTAYFEIAKKALSKAAKASEVAAARQPTGGATGDGAS